MNDEEEHALLVEVADDIGLAIYSIEQEGMRKRAEEELLKLNAQLKQRIAERTQELQAVNQELNATNEKLNASNEELTAANQELAAINQELNAAQEELQAQQDVLAKSEAQFRAIFERSTVGKSLTGPDGRLLKVNQAFAGMLGYSIAEMQTINFAAITHPDDLAQSRESIRCLLANERDTYRFEKRYFHKNGTVVWANVSTTLLRDAQGAPLHFITSISDITERKRLENEIQTANEELTASNQQLSAANQELTALNQELQAAQEELEHHRDQLQLMVDEATKELRDANANLIKEVEEREKAEAALRESENLNRTVIDQSPLGISVRNRYGQLIIYNRQWKRIWAMTDDDIRRDLETERTKLDLDEKDSYLGKWSRDVEKVYTKGGVLFVPELKITKPAFNDTRYVSQHFYALSGADGSVERVVIITDDITERKRTEERLDKERRRAQTYLDMAGVMMLALDRNGAVALINRNGCDILDWPEAEIVGRDWFDNFLPPEIRTDMRRVFQRMMAGEDQPFEYYESAIVNRSGQARIIAWHNVALRDEEGGLIGTLSSGEDVTQRKQMEQELHQAQKMEAIGQLAGGVAHDFNNMLAGIMGNAEMLYMKLAASPEHMELVERILKAGEHAADLIKQLLSFSRKGQYQQKPVDLHQAISDVISILSNTIDRRIRISQNLRARPSTVMGDPTQIENALMNLGLNARDAMPEGGELIFSTDIVEVDERYVQSHKYRVKPGHYIMISVTDTGIGMDENIRSHIFEPFFTTKVPGRGTGLGLASVYGIAKNHKGSIEAYSEPGHGTAMKIY
ncbi:MAG: PAS domain S-box protein, partial [Candidatus Edwardsbacteria bacterium]|nr:PAS domain S-box protein [Candidatus Edwardsbacteria bacterium]